MLHGMSLRRGAVVVSLLTGLLVTVPAAVCAAGGGSLLGAAAAYAADPPDSLVLTGPDLPDRLTVQAEDRPSQFAALLGEVSWLADRVGQGKKPDADLLGAKYTVTVFRGSAAVQQYDLYPLATGGPRVYRPASQPDKRKVGSGWFYGRLTLPETLRAIGVPLSATVPAVAAGGIGGGGGAEDPEPADTSLDTLFSDWRHFLLLNGAVGVVITLGLAGVTLLNHRRADRVSQR